MHTSDLAKNILPLNQKKHFTLHLLNIFTRALSGNETSLGNSNPT